jgi:hypothetical protein
MPVLSFLVEISFVQFRSLSLLFLACITWEASFFIISVHFLDTFLCTFLCTALSGVTGGVFVYLNIGYRVCRITSDWNLQLHLTSPLQSHLF